jgi:hypothetical protein
MGEEVLGAGQKIDAFRDRTMLFLYDLPKAKEFTK